MAKKWAIPELKELNISETALDQDTGTEKDYGVWNDVTGEITFYYYSAGHTGGTIVP